MPLFAFALAGLLAGHGLSYVIAAPDPHHRDLLLETTGHAYLPMAGRVSLILLLAAIATITGRAFMSRGSDAPATFGALAGRLAAVQVAAFAGLEVLERLISGAPLGHLMGDRVLPLGIAVQVAVAIVGAVILRWLIRASSRLAAHPRLGAVLLRPAAVLAVPVTRDLAHGIRVRTARSVRAPPSA